MAKTDGRGARPAAVTPDVQAQFDLVRRYRASDGTAFEPLQRRLMPVVLATIRAKGLADSGEVDDPLADIWLRVAGGLPGFRFRSAPTTWVRTIAANVCNDHLRQQQRQLQERRAAGEMARLAPSDSADDEQYTSQQRRAARRLLAINRLIEAGMPWGSRVRSRSVDGRVSIPPCSSKP